MSTEQLKPKGEKLRTAVRWISEVCREDPKKSRKKIVREAEMRFDLSPRECEFLNEKFV